MQQATIARRVAWRGTGLHGGEEVEVALCPADVGTGIVFVRPAACAEGSALEIPAHADRVLSTSRATTLAGDVKAGDAGRVATVEHLLATLYAVGIDNLRVEISGSEIPVMDGSAAPLLERVREAGRVAQSASRLELSIDGPLEIREGDRWIRVDPAESLSISYAIEFAHPCIGRQEFELPRLDEEIFERELAAARTFGFAHEVEALRDAGLAHGGSFENTIVLDDSGILNTGGLRWPDEFVRHKVIDLVGDLALLGARLNAHVQVEKGGHRLHHRLVRALLDQAGQAPDPRLPPPIETGHASGRPVQPISTRS